jgi:hypothetical protein
MLIVKNSSLGKAEVTGCDFSKFKRIIMQDSSIIDVIPTSNIWCERKTIESKDYTSLRENFRQLKNIMSKHSDKPMELFFEREEMSAYLAQLKSTNGNYWDRFILITNWLSNDFGQNWTRALLLLFATNIVWYTVIKFSLSYTVFDINLILDEIGRFLQFLNPIHAFDKTFKVENTNSNLHSALVFDGMSRILSSYLIFQFVRSFRKFARY